MPQANGVEETPLSRSEEEERIRQRTEQTVNCFKLDRFPAALARNWGLAPHVKANAHAISWRSHAGEDALDSSRICRQL